MYSFRTVKYGKRPTTIYVSKDEYDAINPKEREFQVYHQTMNGPFYVGIYRHIKYIKDIVVLRRSLF